MSLTIEGQLEVDHERGVVYFHAATTGTTRMRLAGLGKLPPNICCDHSVGGVALEVTFPPDRESLGTGLKGLVHRGEVGITWKLP